MNENEFQLPTGLPEQPEIPENQELDVVEEQQEESGPKDVKQSWKDLRDKADLADKYQRERDEYARVLKYIEEQALMHQRNQQPQQEEESFDVNKFSDDDLVSGRDLKKAYEVEERKRKKFYEDVQRQQRESQQVSIEQQLNRKYEDLYDVINESNIAKLKEIRPGLARSLHMNDNYKEKVEETYLALKDLGIAKSNSQSNDYSDNKINRNMSKPKSSNSVFPQSGDSPLNQANLFQNGFTKDVQKKLYKEMLEKAGYQ